MFVDIQAITQAFQLLDPGAIGYAALGVAFGVVLGLIPGLNASIGMALILPLALKMQPLDILVMMMGIYAGGMYGGSISAITINVPGTASAMCTGFDGYPMNQQGRGIKALSIAIFASTFGGLIGMVFIVLAIKYIGDLVLKLGSFEMFVIIFMALSIIATISPESMAKAFFAGMVGLMLGTIGIAPAGFHRGTMGIIYLLEGLPIVPTLIGLFAFKEILFMAEKEYSVNVDVKQISKQNFWKELGEGFLATVRNIGTVLRGSVIGIIIGSLPAAGGAIATTLAYGEAKRYSKHPELFGQGAEEGVVAPESANNASEGGALATALLLGIPGSTATALVLASFTLMGWAPGPQLINQHKDVIYGVLIMNFFEILMLIPVGIFFIVFAYRIALVPAKILVPVLSVLCFVGAYASRGGLVFDIGVMIVTGTISYALSKLNYPIIALLLGFVLAPMLDQNLARVIQLYGLNYAMLLKRPIGMVLVVVTVLTIARSVYLDYKRGVFSIGKRKPLST